MSRIYTNESMLQGILSKCTVVGDEGGKTLIHLNKSLIFPENHNEKNALPTGGGPAERASVSNYQLDASNGCPYGCTNHKPGCDIKGNISYNTGEKIFHVPGQEFYSQTVINPDYGERWFCSENEAIQNGWRKAYR